MSLTDKNKQEMERNFKTINRMIDQLSEVDMQDRDGISIESDVLSDENRRSQENNFKNKPLGFKYEMTDRDTSIVPLSVQKSIATYLSESVIAEQSRMGSIQSDQTLSKQIKPEIIDYVNKVNSIKACSTEIQKNVDFTEDEKYHFAHSLSLELQEGISNKNGKMKIGALRGAEVYTNGMFEKMKAEKDLRLEINGTAAKVESKIDNDLSNEDCDMIKELKASTTPDQPSSVTEAKRKSDFGHRK